MADADASAVEGEGEGETGKITSPQAPLQDRGSHGAAILGLGLILGPDRGHRASDGSEAAAGGCQRWRWDGYEAWLEEAREDIQTSPTGSDSCRYLQGPGRAAQSRPEQTRALAFPTCPWCVEGRKGPELNLNCSCCKT